jgi:hypothetical protein
MSTKSRDRMYGAEVRISAQRAAAVRKEADKLACEAWNKRMLGFRGPAQPSPTLGDALNAGFAGIGLGQFRCKDEARRLAKYGEPKFPSLVAFGTFLRGDDYIKTGVVTLFEDEAQFQNGFGAMVHSTVKCKYDLNSEKVVNVSISAN